MRTYFTRTFKKHYHNRIFPSLNLNQQFRERRNLFIENSRHSILKDHPLSGKMKGFRAFSVTGDIRVIYYIRGDIAYFVDIGTHNQVYS